MEQNGVAERINNTLLEMVNSILHENEVPFNLSTKVHQTALYLRHRTPTAATLSGKTRFKFEFWNSGVPILAILRFQAQYPMSICQWHFGISLDPTHTLV